MRLETDELPGGRAFPEDRREQLCRAGWKEAHNRALRA